MKKRKSFIAGFLAGMTPAPVFERCRYPSLEGSDTKRMRGDVERVGQDFCTVMDRENGSKKALPARAQARMAAIQRFLNKR